MSVQNHFIMNFIGNSREKKMTNCNFAMFVECILIVAAFSLHQSRLQFLNHDFFLHYVSFKWRLCFISSARKTHPLFCMRPKSDNCEKNSFLLLVTGNQLFSIFLSNLADRSLKNTKNLSKIHQCSNSNFV